MILTSLYLSALSTIICAIVANYTTLLLSRALLGFCCGLRCSTLYVWAAELVSSEEMTAKILLVTGIMFHMGGMWSSVLGYLLLERVGWRTFLLFSSLPVIIPPIFMLHFCFTKKVGSQIEVDQNKKEVTTVPNFAARTAKLGLFMAIVHFNGDLTTLLVPALIQLLNIEEAGPTSDCSVTMTQGPELLLLGLVTFAAIPSSLLAHWMKDKIGFCKLQGIIALIYTGNFVLMLTQQSLAVAILTNFIAKFLFGITSLSYFYVLYDVNYYGTDKFALGSSISTAMGLIGGTAGSAMVSFAPISSVVITALVLSALQMIVIRSMTEL